jgi:transposase
MDVVGLDVHLRTSSVHILDVHGKCIDRKTTRGHWTKMVEYLKSRGRPFVVCFEASCGYGAIYEQLNRIAARVVVAHPGRVRMIFRAKRKNDRLDAEKLATLLYLDAVPPVYVPGVYTRNWRALIGHRRRLIEKRTRCKNGIRTLLRGQGIQAVKGLWTRRGRAWLGQLALPPACRWQRDSLVEELEHFDRQIRQVTAQLNGMHRDHPGVALLQTIPGVGPRTAEAVVAYIDDPSRFGRIKQVGAYFGLVPRQDASGQVNRLGRITKDGPSLVRKLLVEASWQAIRRSAVARAFFDRIAGEVKDRRKVALVATAHWLLRCMLAMLRTGEPWRHAV